MHEDTGEKELRILVVGCHKVETDLANQAFADADEDGDDKNEDAENLVT